MTRQTLLALALVCLLGVSGAVPGAYSASRDDAPTLTRTVVLDGLKGPWDLAFTPDGALLVTEKCRGLSVLRADGTLHHLFGREGAAVAAPDFFCQGQSGAHGIAVDPAFAHTRLVYLFMPSTLARPPTNRVVRLVVDPGYTTVSARTDIVPDIPFKHAANAVGGAGAHSGGRLRFGPEGFLYITTGDNHQPTLPQDLTRLGGKVLRVDRDGQPAPGNQTPAGGTRASTRTATATCRTSPSARAPASPSWPSMDRTTPTRLPPWWRVAMVAGIPNSGRSSAAPTAIAGMRAPRPRCR